MLHNYCNIYTVFGTLLVRNDVKIHKRRDTYTYRISGKQVIRQSNYTKRSEIGA